MIGLSPDNTFRILHWLRVTSFAVQLVVVSAAELVLGEAFRAWPLLAVTACHVLWHGGLLIRIRTGLATGGAAAAGEVAVDLLVITALLGLAGGWTNPFASVYLVPLGFAAGVLSLRASVAMAILAIVCYAVTVRFYVPLPHAAPLHGETMNMHLIGMALSFLLASVVLVVTVALVRRAHDGERRALAREREARLRDEQLLSLGVLAASTAHELGTPLSTARLLVEELEQSRVEPDTVAVLRRQLDYAVARLHELVRVADDEVDEAVSLEQFCAGVADRLRTLRPDVSVDYRADLADSPPVRYSRPLESALLSLMINAATASAAAGRPRVEVVATIEAAQLLLRIRDFGSGFGGRGPRDNGSAGLGVGLVISSATLERFGGEARHFDCEPGTETVVHVPLNNLAVAA